MNPTTDTQQPRHETGPPRATMRFMLGIAMIAMLLSIWAYWPVRMGMPVGDDWGPPLTEVQRGNAEGWTAFFTETRQLDSYRPLQSLLIWLFGRADEPARWAWIRVLHFICLAVFVAASLVIARLAGLGRAGAVVAIVTAAIHPTLAPAVGSVDGFSSTLSTAAVGFGIASMVALRRRPWLAMLAAIGWLVAGTLVKEYAFALWPAAALTALVMLPRGVLRSVLVFFVMGLATFVLLWMRQFVRPDDMVAEGADFELRDPKTIAMNVGLVAMGGLFTGNSLWVYVDRSPLALASVAVSVGVVVLGLLLGLLKWFAADARTADADAGDPARDPMGDPARDPRRWAVLLFLMPAAMSFPANLVMRIGEMYCTGVILTTAVLFGLAFDGLLRRGKLARRVAIVVALLLLIQAMWSLRDKSHAIAAEGVKARHQTDQLVRLIDERPTDRRVLLLFRQDLIPARATFGAYRLDETKHVRPPAVDWFFYGRGISLTTEFVEGESGVASFDVTPFDQVLLWDASSKTYSRLK